MKGNILVLHHLLLLVCLIAITITKTDAKIVHHKWVVKYEYKSPGCFKKLSITINGRIPGPTIVAQQGDTVIVEVTNKLETENLAIHWHGIRQIGTPWSDGTEGVTQCPVLPGDTFTYRFVVDRSLLTQGKGSFNCSASPSTSDPSICSVTNPKCSSYSVTVIPGKTYQLRVSSLTSVSALSFQIEGHNMTVVETDDHYVEPFVVQNLFIYSRKTYYILIKMDQDPSRNYWITTNVVSCNSTTPPGLTILNYYPNHPQRSPPSTPPGVLTFHCHIESHFYMGMGLVSEEDIEKVGDFPSSIMGCDDTRGYHNPSLLESSGNFNGSYDEALVLKNKSQEIEPYLNGRCIYLVGMMGSGKTTVGKILSQVLKYSFRDSDSLIEEDAGGTSVLEIFKLYGEGYFREKETEILRRLSIMDRLVVSPGGGAVTRPINWKHMRRGISVWLDVPLEALAQRIAAVGTHSRPLLHNESGDPYTKVYNRLSTLLEERGEAYSNANARVSLENIAAKRGLRDVSFVSPTAVAIEALGQIKAYLEERDGML